MVNNHSEHADHQGSDSTSNTNNSVPATKPGWRMLSSSELETVSAFNRSNGAATDSRYTSGTQNAFASSSKSVLPMHSLIDAAPSPLPLVTTASSAASSVIPEYVPTGAVVPRPHEGKLDTDTIAAGSTLPAIPADGRTLCVRHQMMADQDANGKLQRVSCGQYRCFASPSNHLRDVVSGCTSRSGTSGHYRALVDLQLLASCKEENNSRGHSDHVLLVSTLHVNLLRPSCIRSTVPSCRTYPKPCPKSFA